MKENNYFYKNLVPGMMIHPTDIQLFQILRQKLGGQEAEALISFDDDKIKESNENKLKILATKENVFALKEDILKLDNKIAETKKDIIKWIFSFFVTLALMIAGLYLRK